MRVMLRRFYCKLFLCLLLSISARADETVYPYKILRAIDGDTFEVEAPFLPLPLKPVLHLRLEGVDTPERGQKAACTKERRRADHAKVYVETELRTASEIVIRLHHWDKFGGRVVGSIYLDGVSLADKLLAQDYAVEYDGGEKSFSWCN